MTGPLLFICDNNRVYYEEKTKEEFILYLAGQRQSRNLQSPL